ncbi:MAG: HYC_CC_PP family protein [Flavisolibacter sp.]
MKKALAAILLLVYFTVSTGFSLSVHYCMDEFESAEIGSSGADVCDNCGMHKDDGCCRDEVKVVKLKTFHVVSQVSNIDLSLPEITVLHSDFLLTSLQNSNKHFPTLDHGPPIVNEDVYLRNCVFKI